jgi:PAS domain S-box-containing protein
VDEQQSDTRVKQRDYLLRIAGAINSRLDLPEVLSQVIHYATEITNGRAGIIALRQPDGNYNVVAASRLEPTHYHYLRPLLKQLPATTGAALDTPQAGEWDSPQVEAELERLAERVPGSFNQVTALPLKVKDDSLGILLVFRSEGAALFTPIDQELLGAFADQAAVAIQNAHLYATLAEQAGELQLLYDFSTSMLQADTAEEAAAAAARHAQEVGASQWAIVLYGEGQAASVVAPGDFHPDDHLLDELRAAGGRFDGDKPRLWPNLLARDDAPAALRDMGLPAAAAFPVTGEGQLLGTLWTATEEPGQYDPDSVRLLHTFARFLGLALDKFHLIGRLETRERQLSRVVERNPAGVLLLDGDGRITLHNPVAASLAGSADLGGRVLAEALGLEDELGSPLPIALPGGEESVTVQGFRRQSAGGRGPYLQVTVSRLAAGQPGFVASLVDLTALRRTEDAKSIFIAGLSHELKTPLALIRGYAETLRFPEARQDQALYDDSLDIILEETNHLTEMVDQMLLAARLQAGVLTLDLHEIAVQPFVERIVAAFRQAYPDRAWDVKIDGALPEISGDPVRLREVLHNLLSNAVHYSPAGSRVEVAAAPAGQGLRLLVRDEGIGISAENRERIFQRFFRASDRADGTGLGLYLSRAIVEAHGGRIRVESELGRGSTFIVELPQRPPKESSQSIGQGSP